MELGALAAFSTDQTGKRYRTRDLVTDQRMADLFDIFPTVFFDIFPTVFANTGKPPQAPLTGNSLLAAPPPEREHFYHFMTKPMITALSTDTVALQDFGSRHRLWPSFRAKLIETESTSRRVCSGSLQAFFAAKRSCCRWIQRDSRSPRGLQASIIPV